ncbi:hypothetical protein [Methanolacinia paynteri]|uniref:hypothetical protein n=1 Tax=Methanolacinia paynteri TaxID=230356 RepID=UPI0012F64FA7|nr:hypothetical protein [Methanolacinia paynteri]
MIFRDDIPSYLAKWGTCILLLTALLLVSGCTSGDDQYTDNESVSVGELLANPEYDTPVYVNGVVSDLGILNCLYFHLTSGGETIDVWYDMMVEDNKTSRPAVDVSGLSNGEEVVLLGELKSEGEYRQKNAFWLIKVE